MRYFVAVVGGLLVFVAVFFITGLFIIPFLPEGLRPNIDLLGLRTNNLAGLILGALAGGSSCRATLRRK